MSSHRWRARGAVVALALALGPFVPGATALAQTAGLTLQAALAALPGSPGWQKADLDYQSALDALASARAAAGLSISADGSYALSEPLGAGGRSGSSAKVSLSASTTVLPWAPADAAVARAETALRIAGLTRDSARAALRVSVEQQYLAARLAATSEGVAQAGLRQAAAKLTAARAQHGLGQLSDQGLAQAQASLAQAQASLAQSQATLELDRRTLFDTLGLEPTSAPLTTAPPAPAAPQGSVDRLVASGVPQRDDVKIARLHLEQAQATLASTATQRWIPAASLDLGVSGSDSTGKQAGLGVSAALDVQKGVLSGSASYPLAPGASGAVSTQLSVGASVTIPLDAPSADAATASARTALASARAALATTERAAGLDIRQRYAAYQTARTALAADQAAQSASKQALDTQRARLAAGLATSLDVGDAQVAYRQAQRTVASDKNALYLALLQLRNALGEPKAPPGGQP